MDMSNGGSALDFAAYINSALRNADDNEGLGGNGGLLWIFLLILFWGGSNGGMFGNRNGAVTDVAVGEAVEKAVAQARANGLSDQVITDAVQGNNLAISQLATTLNCDFNQVNNVLNTISGGIDKLSGQMGLSSQQIINSVQSGNAALSTALQSCCCQISTSILTQGYENKIATLT